MRQLRHAFLVVLVGMWMSPSLAPADEFVLLAGVQFASNPITAPSPLTQVSVTGGPGVVVTETEEGRYTISRPGSGALSTRVTVRLEKLPDGFHFSEIALSVPYFVDELSISPTVLNAIPGDRDEIAWLRNRDPNAMNGETLFEYYARAMYQGDFFAKTESPAGASRDGVKAVYSMLQAAKQMLATNNVALGSGVMAGAAWLDAAVQDSLPVVKSAVTAAAAKQVVEQVRQIELDTYVILWRKIRTQKIARYAEYCTLMKRLQTDIERSGALRQKISLHQNLGVLVATAHAECLGRGWKKYVAEGDRNQRDEMLAQQIQFLEEQRDLLPEGDSENAAAIDATIDQLVTLRETELASNTGR